MITDVEYYGRRAREEREATMRAANPQVREIHRQLADAYELRVRGLSAEERRQAIHLVSAA
jgi:hypothetical protein